MKVMLYSIVALLGMACMISCGDQPKVSQLKVLGGYPSQINEVIFSPDSQLLISSWHSIELWGVPSGRTLGKLDEEPSFPKGMAFSPDGKTLLSESRGKIFFWDMDSHKIVKKVDIDLKGFLLYFVRFSPDNTLLAVALHNEIDLWNLTTGENIATLKTGKERWVVSLAFSPDGKLLASGSQDKNENLKLWDISSKKCIATLTGHEVNVNSVTFSPDNKLLASGDLLGKILLWDVPSKKLIGKIEKIGTSDIRGLSFSPDGKLLASGTFSSPIAGGSGPGVCIWNVATRKLLTTLQGHTDAILTTAFSPDGKYLASGQSGNSGENDGIIILWKFE